MTRYALALFSSLLLFIPDISMTQSRDSEYGSVVVIFKYDHTATIWGREAPGGELTPGARGELFRSFPTGPKIVFGDERIPEGIYDGRIDDAGNVTIVFETWPGMPEFNEVYRITGPTLDRNVLSLRDGFEEEIRIAALAMTAAGHRRIPVVILPGTLEPEVAEFLGKARSVREGQRLEDVERSIIRWKPVEDYIVTTGRIPVLRFNDGVITIEEQADATPPELANK